jgi:hypothetical protein
MEEEKAEVSVEGLSRLQSAAQGFARVEIDRIVQVVIGELRSRRTTGIFQDISARDLWDEYTWSVQEGPFDVDTGLGSIDDAFEDTVRAVILAEVERLPKHAQVLLSVEAVDEEGEIDEPGRLGCIWIEGIAKLVKEAVKERASGRNLHLIGPDSVEEIVSEFGGDGFVWSVLADDSSVAMGLIRDHMAVMIDPKADLSSLADEMVEVFLAIAAEDEDSRAFGMFLEHFGGKLRPIIKEDAVASVEQMRRKLLEAWDK